MMRFCSLALSDGGEASLPACRGGVMRIVNNGGAASQEDFEGLRRQFLDFVEKKLMEYHEEVVDPHETVNNVNVPGVLSHQSGWIQVRRPRDRARRGGPTANRAIVFRRRCC